MKIGGRRQPARSLLRSTKRLCCTSLSTSYFRYFGDLALQQLEAERVDRADEHLGQAWDLAERLAGPRDDPLLELGSGLLRERERDDVPRREPVRLGQE